MEEELPGEVFGAGDAGAFAGDFEVPGVAGGEEGGVGDRLEELGAGEVEGHRVLVGDDGHFQRLGVDVEAVLAEADDVLAFDVEVLLVLELADAVLAQGLDAGLEVVRLDRIAEPLELADQVADLFDHRIGREVGMDRLDLVEGRDPVADAGEDALGGLEEGAGAFAAGLDELGAAAFEGVVDLLAADGDLLDVFVELGELPFELLDLDHQAGQRFVDLFRRVAEVEVVCQRLREQLHLRRELGLALAAGEFAAFVAQRAAGAVEAGVEGGDALDDRGGLGRVGDLEAADDLDQHFQLGRGLVEGGGDLVGFGDLGDLRQRGFLGVDRGGVGLQGVLA